MAQKYVDDQGRIYYSFPKITKKDFHYGCFNCKYLNEDYQACPAYPNGIPDDILTGKRIHRQVWEDQTGKTTFKTLPDIEIENRMGNIRIDHVFKILTKELSKIEKVIEIDQKENNGGNFFRLKAYKNGVLKALKTMLDVFGFGFVEDK